MNRAQENDLLVFLDKLGFTGNLFEEVLKQKIRNNLPNFTIGHLIDFGEERMKYDLNFVKDHQFDGYRLEKFRATHRSPVMIEHSVINGIDTAELEERMKGKNWASYFGSEKLDTENPDILEMRGIAERLKKLSEGQNFDGIEVQEELKYKYWPSENYFSNGKGEFKQYHERSREFTASEWGICNANLAYHLVSGRLENLHEKLQSLGLETWPEIALYDKLEKILSRNPDSFSLEIKRNEPGGYCEISIPVKAYTFEFNVGDYSQTLIPYPEIIHGNFNGVDTKELEVQMRGIDWNNDHKLFAIQENEEPQFYPMVAGVFEKIQELSLDLEGSKVAEQLQLKYWTDATFVDSLIPQTAWDQFEKLPRITQKFPVELNAKAGFNLLCGRAIAENLMFPERPESDKWVSLDMTKIGDDGRFETTVFSGLSKEEIENNLKLLPLPNSSFYQIRNSLLRGDIVPAALNNGDKTILLEADATHRTLNIYTPDFRPIPFNFNLDPDWKPHQKNDLHLGKETGKEHHIPKKILPSRIHRKSRGRKF